MSSPLCTPMSTAALAAVNWLGGITSCTSALTVAQYMAEAMPGTRVIAHRCQSARRACQAMYAVANTVMPRATSRATPRYRRSKRSMRTPPMKGMNKPGKVTTITCRLTFTVEWVAVMMNQLTPAKFMPPPKSEINMAAKKYRKPRWAQINVQSMRLVTAVAMELTSLLLRPIWVAQSIVFSATSEVNVGELSLGIFSL